MKQIIRYTKIVEPIHEYFVTICTWCGKELPEQFDLWCGYQVMPGDICPHCGKPLAEEVEEGA